MFNPTLIDGEKKPHTHTPQVAFQATVNSEFNKTVLLTQKL